jgi:hypothetical protein
MGELAAGIASRAGTRANQEAAIAQRGAALGERRGGREPGIWFAFVGLGLAALAVSIFGC